jgi:hypothetical protein
MLNEPLIFKIEPIAQKQSMEDGSWNADLVARKGKVIYQSFGYQTYEKGQKSLIQICMMLLQRKFINVAQCNVAI